MDNNNNALLERLEKVIDTLSDNSIKMGQMLAVHDEKLEKQDRIDAVLFEKIKQVDEKLDKQVLSFFKIKPKRKVNLRPWNKITKTILKSKK